MNEPTKTEPTVIIPRVDIFENDAEVLLIADMPGVNDKGVDIDLQRNCLTIKGTRQENTEEGLDATTIMILSLVSCLIFIFIQSLRPFNSD